MNVKKFSSLVQTARRLSAVLILLLAVVVLGHVGWLRGPEYDEGYTVFLAAGQRLPTWPVTFRAGEVRGFYAGHSTAAGIARDLRSDDVHPPLYFWAVAAWRGVFGTSLAATRTFSMVLGLASLALVGVLARQTALPIGPAMLMTLLSYGFAYTAAIARGFELAQLLCLTGLTLAVAADRRRRPSLALAAGLAFGAATFSNYLACFVGVAVVLWLMRRWALGLAAAAGGLAWLPAVAWFLAAQLQARPSQFPPFQAVPALVRLLRYQLAALFGGLPLYAGWAAPVVSAAVVALAALLLGAVAWQWRAIGTIRHRWLVAMVAGAPAAGLVALGLLSGRAPIELRYLVLGLPAMALLIAGALFQPARRGRLQRGLGGIAVAVQAASIAGLMLRAETMQPQGAAAAAAARMAADALVLVPRGNDGVGVAGAFLSAAPDGLLVRIVAADDTPASLRAAAGGRPRIAAALLALDDASRAEVATMRAAFANPCWRATVQEATLIVWDRSCTEDCEQCSTASR